MSEIYVEFKDNIITIEKKRVRQTPEDKQKIDIKELEYKQNYKSKIKASNKKTANKVFLLQELEGLNDEGTKDAVIVYSKNGKIYYKRTSAESAYKTIVKIKSRVLKISLNKRYFSMYIFAYLMNPYKENIENITLSIDNNNFKEVKLKTYLPGTSKIKRVIDGNIYKVKFDIKEILNSNEAINNSIEFRFKINGNEVSYKIPIKDKKIVKKKKIQKYYYTPIVSKYIDNYAVHVRRTLTRKFSFCKKTN